jgi:hypothetical protein
MTMINPKTLDLRSLPLSTKSNHYMPWQLRILANEPNNQHQELKNCLAVAGSIPHCSDPYWGTEIGNSFACYRIYLICEFWRKFADSKFSLCKPSKQIRKDPAFESELHLWIKVFPMLERMHSFGKINHPTQVFCQLIMETGGLLMANILDDSLAPLSGKSEFVQRIQHQNAEINSKNSNPFQSSTHPISHQVIEQAIQLANTSDQFRGQFFNPMILARGKLVQALRKSGSDIYKSQPDGTASPMVRPGRRDSVK